LTTQTLILPVLVTHIMSLRLLMLQQQRQQETQNVQPCSKFAISTNYLMMNVLSFSKTMTAVLMKQKLLKMTQKDLSLFWWALYYLGFN